MLQAAHFPLGSTLLQKTGLGNQWAVARVVAIHNELIKVAPVEVDESQAKFVKPNSDSILPLVLHTDISIVIGKGVLQ